MQRRYCTATELQVIQNALPKETLLTILTHLWAAKEAAKKALSIWWMPGFLDLVVMDATIEYADCLRLTLSVPAQQHDTSIPRKVNVLASAISDYSMAVCFINKDPVNA